MDKNEQLAVYAQAIMERDKEIKRLRLEVVKRNRWKRSWKIKAKMLKTEVRILNCPNTVYHRNVAEGIEDPKNSQCHLCGH